MPLWLSEDDVASLVTPAEAVPVIEACFLRMAAGEVELMPRRRFPVDGGYFAVMAATDRGLGVAGVKSYTLVNGKLEFVVCLFDTATGALLATIAADRLGQIRTGAATGVAAKHLAREGAASVGLIGAGWQAQSQLAAIRAAVPTIDRTLVASRTPEKAAAFAEANDALVASSVEVGACDIVITVTTSKRPVLEGSWLAPGALVCAVGANDPRARELDDAAIERATFICCDSIEDAKLESGDLISPIADGRLGWPDVHELHEVVSGRTEPRSDTADIVLFKSNGIAPWDLALAHEVVARARA
ncbi:MAG: ornithine cyclodeaminase family protein [Gaiellales bacterium]